MTLYTPYTFANAIAKEVQKLNEKMVSCIDETQKRHLSARITGLIIFADSIGLEISYNGEFGVIDERALSRFVLDSRKEG